MRRAPSRRSRAPASVSRHWVRRPFLVGASHPSVAVRASACRAAVGSTPNPPSTSTNVVVQIGRVAGNMYSPSTVSNNERAEFDGGRRAWISGKVHILVVEGLAVDRVARRGDPGGDLARVVHGSHQRPHVRLV